MVDYVIVGAGSAGCVLAARLSEDPAIRVLVLEAGGARATRELAIPAAWSKLFRSEVDWDYATTPQAALGGREIYWPRGKALGGSSAINAMMAIPGHRSDYDGWCDLGNRGWSFADVAPAFQRVSAALAVEEQRDPNPLTRAFLEAAGQAGVPRSGTLGLDDLEGARLAPVTQRKGRRRSSADAYLRPALSRPNLRVLSSAHATRVLVEDGRAVGVAYRRDGTEEAVRCAREVVLCGGTVNSPQLLLLSGIGPRHALDRHGIPLVCDLPGVGENLQDHFATGLLVSSTRPVTLYAAERRSQLLRYLALRRGLLTSNVAEAAAFVHSRPGLAAPDLELVFCPVLFNEQGLAPPPGHGFTIGIVVLQPRSRGHIRLRSADPLAKPVINPRYLSERDDLETLARGLELARRVVSMPALAGFRGDELAPGNRPLEEHLQQHGQTIYHPVGTCRMGTDDLAVVDAELRVRGVAGLRVADASVMPRIPRGHTNLPAMMIGERAAELIRAGTPAPRGEARVPAGI